jgi:hypothetical protein
LNIFNKTIIKHTWVHFLVLALLVLPFPGGANAGERETLRTWVGIDIFPSFLAADRDIVSKTGSDGKLLLVLKYIDDKETAEKMARHLKKINTIRGIPIRIELVNDASLEAFKNAKIAGIFITEKDRFPPNIIDLLDFGRKNHVIIFSPFTGDVEAGVAGGIFISDRILPYVNIKTLQLSGIRIKPFFLRIAKTYE